MNFIKNILRTFIIGSSDYLNGFSIIIAGLIDSILYIICFYLSMKILNNNYKISKQEIQSINEPVELLIRTENDLYDLIKDLIKNTTTNQNLIQNSLNKLNTLEYLHKDCLITIKRNINLNHLILTDSYIINRIYFYICTFSFFLYIYQIILWFFHYFILKNSKKYFLYSYILSTIILSQSLGLIYFLHITNTCYLFSLLYIYTWIFFIRTLLNIYHQTFSNY